MGKNFKRFVEVLEFEKANRNMTIRELADLLGYSRRQVNTWLNRDRMPQLCDVENMMLKLGYEYKKNEK